MLYILQHGNAVSKEENPDRPLSTDGRRDVERLAEYLAEKGTFLQRIFHSGKLRAEQTATIISERLAPGIAPEVIEGINPNDDPKKFIREIEDVNGVVLIASHMLFVSKLCSTLLTSKPDALFSFSPGTIACVGCEDGKWSLQFMIQPGNL